MPRSPSSRRKNKWQQAPRDLADTVAGMRTSRSLPDGSWSVQTVKGNASGKVYVCPGCGQTVAASVTHTVAWRLEAAHGTEIGVEARRHWHPRCFERFR